MIESTSFTLHFQEQQCSSLNLPWAQHATSQSTVSIPMASQEILWRSPKPNKYRVTFLGKWSFIHREIHGFSESLDFLACFDVVLLKVEWECGFADSDLKSTQKLHSLWILQMLTLNLRQKLQNLQNLQIWTEICRFCRFPGKNWCFPLGSSLSGLRTN